MASAAEQVAAAGADLIDLNMGCPVPKVMKTGAGAALLKDPDTAVAVATVLPLVGAGPAPDDDAVEFRTVTATGTYDGPKFRRLQLTVSCDAPAEQVERLLEPALRVCYVSNTIALSPPIEVALG